MANKKDGKAKKAKKSDDLLNRIDFRDEIGDSLEMSMMEGEAEIIEKNENEVANISSGAILTKEGIKNVRELDNIYSILKEAFENGSAAIILVTPNSNENVAENNAAALKNIIEHNPIPKLETVVKQHNLDNEDKAEQEEPKATEQEEPEEESKKGDDSSKRKSKLPSKKTVDKTSNDTKAESDSENDPAAPEEKKEEQEPKAADFSWVYNLPIRNFSIGGDLKTGYYDAEEGALYLMDKNGNFIGRKLKFKSAPEEQLGNGHKEPETSKLDIKKAERTEKKKEAEGTEDSFFEFTELDDEFFMDDEDEPEEDEEMRLINSLPIKTIKVGKSKVNGKYDRSEGILYLVDKNGELTGATIDLDDDEDEDEKPKKSKKKSKKKDDKKKKVDDFDEDEDEYFYDDDEDYEDDEDEDDGVSTKKGFLGSKGFMVINVVLAVILLANVAIIASKFI